MYIVHRARGWMFTWSISTKHNFSVQLKMYVHINDLSYDLLRYLFNFLPDKEIFKIEITCKNGIFCVKKSLNRKKFQLEE